MCFFGKLHDDDLLLLRGWIGVSGFKDPAKHRVLERWAALPKPTPVYYLRPKIFTHPIICERHKLITVICIIPSFFASSKVMFIYLRAFSGA